MRTLLAPLLVALVATQAFGCTTKTVVANPAPSQESPEETTPTEEGEETTPKPEAEAFGDPLDPKAPLTGLSEILADPEAFSGEDITTEGVVRQVCQKRGCWAEIRPASARESETMRVTFKGYAFFLPKDARGATVKIGGRVSVQLISAEQVAHLEEEGATFTNKKPDGSAIATEFVAAGVEMTGRKK